MDFRKSYIEHWFRNVDARVDGIAPGSSEVTFPDLDQSAWAPA